MPPRGLLALWWKCMGAALTPMLLQGCTGLEAMAQGAPVPYHDTRLQAALVTNDQATLSKTFSMDARPSLLERGVAVLLLPFSAGTETAFLPFWVALKYSTQPYRPPTGAGEAAIHR